MNKNKMMVAVLMALGSLSAAHAADAETAKGKFGWVAKMDLEFGGDEVARVYFTDNTNQSVRAGQGVNFAGGVHYQPADSKFDFSATVGAKFLFTAGDNANIHMRRFVLEARADYWINDSYWVGIGPVYHTGIKLDGDGFMRNINFDDAFGFTAKAGYKNFVLSYTNIDYKVNGIKIKGSNIGLGVVGRF